MEEIRVLHLLLGVLAPVLVGLITKGSWPGQLKAVALLALVAGASVVEQAIQAGGFAAFDWRAATFAAVTIWVTAVASHFGLLKPAGVTAWAQRNVVRDPAG